MKTDPIHSDQPIRTVTLAPPSGHETVAVLRLAVVIAISSMLLAQVGKAPSMERALLQPFQESFENLKGTEWMLCNELRSALEEIAAIRINEGRWATPKDLAAEFVPPFAPLPKLSGEVRYTWKMKETAGIVNYTGQPQKPEEGPYLLLRLEKADPLADPVHQLLVGSDSFHQKLQDTVVHFSIWLHRGTPDFSAKDVQPEMQGWKQVIVSFEAQKRG